MEGLVRHKTRATNERGEEKMQQRTIIVVGGGYAGLHTIESLCRCMEKSNWKRNSFNSAR